LSAEKWDPVADEKVMNYYSSCIFIVWGPIILKQKGRSDYLIICKKSLDALHFVV
jgi:hypothetical protein